ncbi:MAG TPA: hypothetical protein VMY40_04695 [Anaerolineae bacterium]|nr:hypothetical protein [Anaerolineae bacterium]
MDHVKILKRAWDITWRYRALWIFGIILALTTASGLTPRGDGNGGVQYELGRDDLFGPGGPFPAADIAPRVVSILIAAGVALACVIVFFMVASAIARWVAEAALIRMVGDYEETSERRSVRQGFRLGWSRTTWRLFLINLLVNLPVVAVFILLFALAVAPFLLWITKSTAAGIIGTIAGIGLFFLILFLAIVVGAAVNVLLRFFRRACALEGLGVIESIRQGLGVVRRHLLDVGLMWLIMLGVQIGLTIATIALVIVLFPVIIALLILGGVLGGVPALLVGGLASLFLEGAVPWVLAALIGIPIFALVVSVPWLFLGGLVEVFKSSVWTLTYRELRALEGLEPEDAETGPEALPELDAPELE